MGTIYRFGAFGGHRSQDHAQFNFTGDVLKEFQSKDTSQKTDILQTAMEKECADLRDNLRNIKGDALKTAAKNNFVEKITELKTAIEKGKDNGTGMLNPDQYLEILNSKGEVVSIQDLKELTNLGDITFRIRTHAQKTEETNKINLEQRRQKEKEAQAQKNTTMETNTKRMQAKLKNEALEKTKQMKSEKETLDYLLNHVKIGANRTDLINTVLFKDGTEEQRNELIKALNDAGMKTLHGKFYFGKEEISYRDVIKRGLEKSGFTSEQVDKYMAKIAPKKTEQGADAEQNIDLTQSNNTPESDLSVTAF
ncbi:MAG: hypothetical protein NTW22_07590 [Proteobacteria bacterium]|nr:hypothetical protein [Pseudomonadota bacterium]